MFPLFGLFGYGYYFDYCRFGDFGLLGLMGALFVRCLRWLVRYVGLGVILVLSTGFPVVLRWVYVGGLRCLLGFDIGWVY